MKNLDIKTIEAFDAFIKSRKRFTYIMLSIEGCGWCDQQGKSNKIVEERIKIETFHLFLEAGSPLREFIINKFGFAYAPSTMIVQDRHLVLVNDPRYNAPYLLNRFHDFDKLIKIANILKTYKHVKRSIYGIYHDACIACSNYVSERRRFLFFKSPSHCAADGQYHVDPKHSCDSFNRADAFKVYKA